jgi:GR25 family glycosyltransferase involved in LPS biosynthesis
MNKFFNKIFVINSKNRIDRYKNMVKRFLDLGLLKQAHISSASMEFNEKYRFEAILGGQINSQNLNFGDKPFKTLNQGEVGCFLSHVTIYKMIKEHKWDKVLILEDDAKFCNNFQEEFDKALKNVPDDWDMIYLGQWNYDSLKNTKTISGKTAALKENICDNIYSADRCWLTHAYAVRLKAVDYLIDNTKVLYSSFDNVLADIQKDLKVYAIHPDLITQDGTKSSLR